MPGREREVAVGRQHHEVMADAQLCQQGVDGAELHAVAAALVPERGGADVIVAVGSDRRQRREALEERVGAARARRLLSDNPRRLLRGESLPMETT